MAPFRPNEVSAGGVVVRRTPRILEVCLVNDGRYWGLPKGNVERGETPEQAALREIEEEVGLPAQRLRVLRDLTPSDYVYRRSGRLIFKRVHQFLVEAPDGIGLTPQVEEISDAVWLSFDDAFGRVSFRDTVTALREARSIIEPESEGGVAGAP